VKIILPGATNPNLSFEMTPDGVMGYYWKDLKLMFSGTYNEGLGKCLGIAGTPSREESRGQRSTESRRSNSMDMRQIDKRLSQAANIVYDSNSLITSFTYPMSLSDMITILSPALANLVCYFEIFEALTGYVDYMGEYFKLLEVNRNTDACWAGITMPTESYIDLVCAHANSYIIACPVETSTTVGTTTVSSISSSSATGAADVVGLDAAIRQLQLLQSNPSLLGSMGDTVRRLVLSLGTTTSSSRLPDDTLRGDDIGTPTLAPAPPAASREVDRHAYLQEKNRRIHLEKKRNKPSTGTTSSV